MKYVSQATIIFAVTLLGELLHVLLPLPIPAAIYGLVLLFLALQLSIVKLEQVKEAGKFMIEIMPVMFIPAGVALITSWGVLKPMLLPVCLITFITIITVMVATGRVSQRIIRKGQDRLK